MTNRPNGALYLGVTSDLVRRTGSPGDVRPRLMQEKAQAQPAE